MSYAAMGFTNCDIDENGQIKPNAPKEQLYNVSSDLSQKTNVAASEPDRLAAMRKRLSEISRTATNKAFGASE
jgi:hypothetical protein